MATSKDIWHGVFERVQHLIGQALKDYRPELLKSVGELPGSTLPPTGPGGNGYPPTPATTSSLGGLVLAGDLDGDAETPTVVAVQNVPYSGTPPTVGQAYVFDGSVMQPVDVLSLTSVVGTDAYHPSRTLHGHIDALYAAITALGAGGTSGWGAGAWGENEWGA